MATNYATCLLDKLPGTENDVAANAIVQLCLAENPRGLQEIAPGSGRGFFGFKSGAECSAKKSKNTRSREAAEMIAVACHRLYNESNYFDKFDR
ncbi:hypothetical protein CTI10_015685 [Delftia acidovorans]|uniref:Uncharacterized protein n=1 Tax=Chryseobacterium sp. B5 TaxID=2050562 RepID=A0A2G7TAR0_9FLAO|nr:hypothetical protein CTI10_015685 [Delftia acidovorans]